jgi:ribonuclease P protein component
LRFFFTKADRILKRPDFLRLSRKEKKISNKNFVATYCPGQFENTRLGITVSKKVGNAAARNRIKRFSREYFRLNRHMLAGCLDINITARKTAAGLTSEQTFLSLKDIFDRISRSNND